MSLGSRNECLVHDQQCVDVLSVSPLVSPVNAIETIAKNSGDKPTIRICFPDDQIQFVVTFYPFTETKTMKNPYEASLNNYTGNYICKMKERQNTITVK